MKAIEFIQNYQPYLDEIKLVIKPELKPVIDDLRLTDPHDLIRPEAWFPSESDGRGFIWSMFVNRVKNREMFENNEIEFY